MYEKGSHVDIPKISTCLFDLEIIYICVLQSYKFGFDLKICWADALLVYTSIWPKVSTLALELDIACQGVYEYGKVSADHKLLHPYR